MGVRARGCAKYSCFGCLGCVGLLLIIALIAGVGTVAELSGPVDQVSRNFEHRPAREGVTLEEWQGREFDGARSERPKAAGVVRLELSGAHFRIEPTPAGTPLRVEANYDRERFRLSETFREETDGRWRYEVVFKKKAMLLAIHHDVEDHEVVIGLPEDLVFALEGNLGIGSHRLELGRLALTDVDIDAGIGEFDVRISEPTARPLSRFGWKGEIGEHRIIGLGNASPAETSIRSSIGELHVDLRGQWKNDGVVRIRHRIGEASVRLPKEGVHFRNRSTSGLMIGSRQVKLPPPPTDPDAPEIELDISSSIGEVRVR